MALMTLNIAAIPVKLAVPALAGLVAGTGAVAAYVSGPASPAKEPMQVVAALPAATSPAPVTSEQVAPLKPTKKPSCEEQAWPYIDNRCIARPGNEPPREVRIVMAPRESEAGPSGAGPKLVTSDGVLRGPGVAPEADQPSAHPAKSKKAKRVANRRQGGDEFRRTYSVYSVPGSGDSAKPVIVVRPLRVNQYSSRF
jgi:hypothetical protein